MIKCDEVGCTFCDPEKEEVKSCRNCTRSVHDGYFHISLKCNATGRWLAEVSKNPDENKAYDAQVIAYAAKCEHYVNEKQV
jgi:hypothetical protein